MIISREPQGTIPASPIRRIFGKRSMGQNVILIAPLDLCLFQIDGGNGEIYKPVDTPNVFNDATIVTGAGGLVGKITSYDWPPLDNFDVNPFVVINPDTTFNPQQVDLISIIFSVSNIDRDYSVELEVGTGIPGTLKQKISTPTYPDDGYRVKEAYYVEFNQNVSTEAHGGRVILTDPLYKGQLLGILIATQNKPTGICESLVYPV